MRIACAEARLAGAREQPEGKSGEQRRGIGLWTVHGLETDTFLFVEHLGERQLALA